MLITLVIIGVVAALTIPNLMQKYTEQTTVKKVQKFYSTLSNAYSLAMKENGPVSGWGLTSWDEVSALKIYNLLFEPYFKIAKNCGTRNNAQGKCIIHAEYKELNNNLTNNFGLQWAYYKVVLDDGAAVWFRGTPYNNLGVFYDVNGIKEPNQLGRDTFMFVIDNEKAYPEGIPGLTGGEFPRYCSLRTSGGNGCAAWVVYKGNMDYLHCDGLKWTSRSCKDK